MASQKEKRKVLKSRKIYQAVSDDSVNGMSCGIEPSPLFVHCFCVYSVFLETDDCDELTTMLSVHAISIQVYLKLRMLIVSVESSMSITIYATIFSVCWLFF